VLLHPTLARAKNVCEQCTRLATDVDPNRLLLACSRRRLDALVGQCRPTLGVSAVEHRPADVVSQPLIIDDEFTNRIWELFTLPPALEPAGAFALAFRGCRAGRFDSVGSRAKFVCGNVRNRSRLPGGICGVPRGSAQRSCRSHGVATRRAGLRHRDFAAYPCPSLIDRPSRPRVGRSRRLEAVQHVRCTRGRPQGEQLMVGVCERAPAADGDQARVAVFREDHGCTCPFRHLPNAGLQLRRWQACRTRQAAVRDTRQDRAQVRDAPAASACKALLGSKLVYNRQG